MTQIEITTAQDIKEIDQLDLRAKYRTSRGTVAFDAKNWTWQAKNDFGFGVDSDLSVAALLRRLLD